MINWHEFIIRYIDSLRAGWSGYRIPVGTRLSARGLTGPGAHPASYTLGTGHSRGVKPPVRGINHPPPSSAEVKERVQIELWQHSDPFWQLMGPLRFSHAYLTSRTKDISFTNMYGTYSSYGDMQVMQDPFFNEFRPHIPTLSSYCTNALKTESYSFPNGNCYIFWHWQGKKQHSGPETGTGSTRNISTFFNLEKPE